MSVVVPDPILVVRDLEVRYGEVVAVEDVDLDVHRGELLALLGPSGCGKTTLLRALAGLERPQRGLIRVAGETVCGGTSWIPTQRRRIGMVFQEGALFPHLDVWRNVLYGVAARDDGEELATHALETVGLMRLRRRYPDELSGGQQQRVALARALAPRPRMVLLDEPFANLDAALRQKLRAEVRSILQQAGATAILVTHDQEEAFSIADRVAVMESGRLLQTGTPEEIYRAPGSLRVARFFGDGRLLDCEIVDGRAHTAFGTVRVSHPDGAARIWVRPEDFHLNRDFIAAADDEGIFGRIVVERFFGHDLLQCVELEDGGEVWVRNLTPDGARVGQRVSVGLRDRAMSAFPEDR